MKFETIRIYCADKYDTTRDHNKCKRSFKLFGEEEQRNTQRTNINKLMVKRNLLYRNKIPLLGIDTEIKDFDEYVNNLSKKQPIKNDLLPLISSKDAPDFHLDEGTANTFLLSGASKRGKSLLMKKIWEKYYKKDKTIISILISPSMHIPLFKDMKGVIKINKFNDSTNKLIEDIKKVQNKTHNAYDGFLIMIDDCINIRYSNVVNELSLLLRNFLINSIISCQYPLMMSKMARSSINNVCAFGLNTDEAAEAMLLFFGNTLQKISGLKKKDLIGEYNRLCQMGDHHSFLKYRPLTRELEHCVLKI